MWAENRRFDTKSCRYKSFWHDLKHSFDTTLSTEVTRFDHFTYNLRLKEKNIWSDYSSFFKPSTQNYLHVDWTLSCIETYMTSCELRAQQSPTIIILPCTFHLEKTCSVGWSVWRVLKSSSWAKATLPAQLTNHDMIFSQIQNENIQEGKFEETRHNKLGSHAFVIICLHAWSWCFRWPIVSTFHPLSNDLKRRVSFS